MEKTAVQRLAAILRTMVLIVFVLNLFCLLFVPGMAVILLDRNTMADPEWRKALAWALHERGLLWVGVVCLGGFRSLFEHAPVGVLSLFFWVCGTCTALILWQAKKILDTLPAQERPGAEKGGGVLLADLRRGAGPAALVAVV